MCVKGFPISLAITVICFQISFLRSFTETLYKYKHKLQLKMILFVLTVHKQNNERSYQKYSFDFALKGKEDINHKCVHGKTCGMIEQIS